jgi:hypothetical protein
MQAAIDAVLARINDPALWPATRKAESRGQEAAAEPHRRRQHPGAAVS